MAVQSCSHAIKLVLLLQILTSAVCSNAEGFNVCGDLNSYFPNEKDKIFQRPTIRMVDPDSGNNTQECLNEVNISDPLPCKTLQFALHGDENPNITVPISDLAVHVMPGTYLFTNTLQILNSKRVAIVSSGSESTFFNCGTFGSEDVLCEYRNLQIRNSSYVYLDGITFTRCGPITSSLYVAESEHIFVENCVFRYVQKNKVCVYLASMRLGTRLGYRSASACSTLYAYHIMAVLRAG